MNNKSWLDFCWIGIIAAQFSTNGFSRSVGATINPSDTVIHKVSERVKPYAYPDGDTVLRRVVVKPVAGDNHDAIQNAVNFAIANPGTEVDLDIGIYMISKPIIWAKIVNGQYVQVTPRMKGIPTAKNTPDNQCTRIVATCTDCFAFGTQLAKGGYLKYIQFTGPFSFPDRLSLLQIDTLTADQWTDGKCRQNPSSPNAAIAIDFASDPSAYQGGYEMYPGLSEWYPKNLSRSGSTAFTMDGISIKNFPVGVIITPSNQQNGEIIHLYHAQIQSCKVAYAICQAQSKQCEVIDLECWGNVCTIFDNMRWGIRHGDGAGSPMIDRMNIAGHVHEIFNMLNQSFHGSYRNIYGEGIFRIGRLGGLAGAEMNSCEIDFENSSPGVPSPDYYMISENTVHNNCIYRLYPGISPHSRIVLNGSGNTFIGGQQTAPPVCKGVDGRSTSPVFVNLHFYYSNSALNRNDYDSLVWLTSSVLHINRSDFSGWFLTNGSAQRRNLSDLKPGMPLITQRNLVGTNYHSQVYPVGFVSRVTPDTVFIQNAGIGFREGETIGIYAMGLKPY